MDFGILEPLLQDPSISEIMINSHQNIFVEKRGQMMKVDAAFDSEEQLVQLLEALIEPTGQRLNESNPIIDVRFPDGSRMHVIGRPIAIYGTSVTLRKFRKSIVSVADLISWGAISEPMVQFIQACVESQLSILIAGGTGSGKTTLMGTICRFIPPDERIITLEQVTEIASELRVDLPHVVALETRPPNLEGRGEITMRHLVQSARKMRPDRILVNEVSGAEAFDLIQAMNTGYTGSILNMHAAGVRDALTRLEIGIIEGNPALPVLGVRESLATAIDVIIYIERMKDGVRRMTSISEITGVSSGVIDVQEIFTYVPDSGGGSFRTTGRIPRVASRVEAGKLPVDMFASR